ncbi:MAG: MerR family transcriptional regulator [Candidatus Omnitrophica bacterium]|nr:MerR family transcriptional regulator [Candidatus Omnitrophota bacterium]
MSIHNIYLIKDLARISGHSIHTIKYYLKIGLIKEISRSPETRFRYFDDSTVQKLKTIHSLRKQDKSIKEIQNELL